MPRAFEAQGIDFLFEGRSWRVACRQQSFSANEPIDKDSAMEQKYNAATKRRKKRRRTAKVVRKK